MENTILDILVDITANEELKENRDLDLFENGLLDSLATVQLLVEIEAQLGVSVPVSEFTREQWQTPNQIIQNVKGLM